MTATEVTESIEIGVGDGKGISVFSVAKSYKKQIRFSINRIRRWESNSNLINKKTTVYEYSFQKLGE
ncbi:MAG: hypothetical protein K8R25_13840 [Methanosarcinales archaeon]|nr:hypothetical protein [Methanosarcinales archaeon]